MRTNQGLHALAGAPRRGERIARVKRVCAVSHAIGGASDDVFFDKSRSVAIINKQANRNEKAEQYQPRIYLIAAIICGFYFPFGSPIFTILVLMTLIIWLYAFFSKVSFKQLIIFFLPYMALISLIYFSFAAWY